MVWDLETRTVGGSPSAGSDRGGDRSVSDRPQPAAYAIPFPHPLTSVSSHPLSSKEFLVSDDHGSIFLTDWRSDPEEDTRRLNVIELVEPRALSDAVSGLGSAGVAAWRADNPDVYVCPAGVIHPCPGFASDLSLFQNRSHVRIAILHLGSFKFARRKTQHQWSRVCRRWPPIQVS